MAQTRTHVALTVTCTSQRGQTIYRLASPTGRTLVLSERDLDGTLYDPSSLRGRGGRLILPVSTLKALSRLGTVEEAPVSQEGSTDATQAE